MGKNELEDYKLKFVGKFPSSDGFQLKYNMQKKPLGAGHFSKVYKATSVNSKDKTQYAVKVVALKKLESMEEVRALENEIEILMVCEHPAIIRLYDVFSNDKEIWLVEEFAPGGELFQRIIQKSEEGLYTEQEAARIVKNLCAALSYLHERKIVHRDVKPENILLRGKDSETRLKLADFGFAAYCEKPLNDPYGTPVYVAPEILVGKPYKTTPDMWSVGIITFILLCGYPPFFHKNQETLAKLIVRTGFVFNPRDWEVVSPEAKNFIRGLLKKRPETRMTADEALKHPWLTTYGAADSQTVRNYLTINTELRKFRAENNLMKAFAALLAYEKIQQLVRAAEKYELEEGA